MKPYKYYRLTIALLLFFCVIVTLNAQKPFYVYRNDGMINGFISTDVDSMLYSPIDIDSILHENFQVQEIYTADSTYRIPLTAIDSISFVTPEIVYQPGVVKIEDSMYPYLIAATDCSLTFSKDIPTDLLPSVGQILVANKYDEPLSTGFSGRVVSIEHTSDGILCNCEGVGLYDIYSKLLVVGKADSYNDDDDLKVKTRVFDYNWGKKIHLPKKKTLDISLKDLLDIKDGDDLNISGTVLNPSLAIKYFICIGEPNMKDYAQFNVKLKSEGNMELKIATSGSLEPDPIVFLTIPFNASGIAGNFDLGVFVNMSGEVNAKGTFPFNIDYSEGFEYSEENGFVPMHGKKAFNWEEPEWELSLEGTVFCGLATKLSFGLLSTKAANVDMTACFGPELSGSFTLASQNEGLGISNDLYETLQKAQITSALKLELEPGYQIGFQDRKSLGLNLSYTFCETTRPLVPKITNPIWTPKNRTEGMLTANVTEDTFIPVKLGWGIYDGDELIKKEYFSDTYWTNSNWTNYNLYYPLSDLPGTYNYRAYPLVLLFDIYEMRVPEYAEVKPKGCPVKTCDFEVTNSYYAPGSFINDGEKYDYKFECSVNVAFYENVSINDLEDWGYVYEEPNGKITHISTSGAGSKDTRYAYYRNTAHSKVCLYGYVKYKGDEQYYYEEPQNYELVHLACPDGNHPHMIDLGLPSGTKWSCCNVGANAPKEQGSYYAWGETENQDPYNGGYCWNTYKYGIPQALSKYCTEKIWGTVDNKTILEPNDDVAQIKWDGNWRMPTDKEMNELIKNCNCEWIVFNKTFDSPRGMLVTGPNGNIIFFPAAGNNRNGNWDTGQYWSSSLYDGDNRFAHSLIFQFREYNSYWNYNISGGERCVGYSVRPVSE